MATIYPRGNKLWLRDGKLRLPLHTSNRKLAKLLLQDYEQEKLRPKSVLRLEAAIEKYLTFIQPFNKPSHFLDKKRILKQFLNSTTNPLLHDVDSDVVVKYLTARDHLSPYRWNTERQSISAVFNWAKARNLYRDANPVGIIFKKKEPRGKAADVLSPAQIKKVHLAIRKNRDMDEAFTIALNGGFRVQEVENQQWLDLNLDNDVIRVQAHSDGWSPKDYEARIIPLNAIATKIYKRRLKLKELSPFIFANERGGKHGKDWITAMSRAMRRAGVEHGGWHRTRHTFATRATENGMDPESLRLLLGLADTKTLLKYIHVSEDYKHRVRDKLPKIG